MKTAIFDYFKVTIKYSWNDNENGDTYSFGSLKGAKEWLANQKEVDWYSIEQLTAYPCKDDDVLGKGQLYYGMGYFEFQDLKEDK